MELPIKQSLLHTIPYPIIADWEKSFAPIGP